MSDERFGKDFHEQFLEANANQQFITAELADVLRNLMRAVASNGPSAALYNASQQLEFALQLIKRCKEPLRLYDLLADAVEDVSDVASYNEVDEARLDAARSGLRYLVESSCEDRAARGRIAQRLRAFERDITWIDEALEAYRKKRR